MKKLTIFVVFLLLTAILCGCAVATTSNTVPTDAPTTPIATQPTEPKPTEPQKPEELSYTSYVAAWADMKKFPNDRLYIIRSVQQLQDVFGKVLTEEQLAKYNDTYFIYNTLLCFTISETGEGQWYCVSDLAETEDGRYSIAFDRFYTNDPDYGKEKISFVVVTEVNRVIEWDTKLDMVLYQCRLGGNVWGKYFGGNFYENNVLTGSVSVEYNLSKIEWETDNKPHCKDEYQLIDSVEKLSDGWYDKIPEQFQKYNEEFFKTHCLYYSRQSCYSNGEETITRNVYITEDGAIFVLGGMSYNCVIEVEKEVASKELISWEYDDKYIYMEPSNKNEYYELYSYFSYIV